jgi:hypothetical protein
MLREPRVHGIDPAVAARPLMPKPEAVPAVIENQSLGIYP